MQHSQQTRKSDQRGKAASAKTTSTTDAYSEPLVALRDERSILTLQRQIGNAAVLRMLKTKEANQPKSDASVQRLPQQLDDPMRVMFGDASRKVRLHNNAEGNMIAREKNADAVTIGQDIYFRDGAYNPGTADGNALIAREMAYVTQDEQSGTTTERTAAQQQEANGIGGIVKTMGSDPSQVLKPAGTKITPMQRQVLQRDYSHMRTAGIVTSKVVQGIFTTVLGPIGLVWRWPLIQKNIGEATGTKVGTRAGKEDDKLRYGKGLLADAMRALSVFGEILKEIVIWLGFATFIAAIVTAATHGAAGPVFAILAALTGGVAIGLAVVKAVLAGFNGYRWNKARKLPDGATKDKKLAHIKAQFVTDGLDGISALLTGIFAILGASGVPSAGGELAKAAGVGESAQKLAGVGLGSATQGLGTSALTNAAKEGGKEASKPGSEKGFSGGLFKDKTEIDNAYAPGVKKVKGFFGFGSKKTVDDAQSSDGGAIVSPEKKEVLEIMPQILNASQRNVVDQTRDSQQSQEDHSMMENLSSKSGGAVKTMVDTQEQFDTAEKEGTNVTNNLDTLVENNVNDEATMDSTTDKVNEGLKKSGQEVIPEAQNSGTQFKGERGSWFSRKIAGLKAGVRRLQNKLMKGVLKYAARFRKTDLDPSVIPTAISAEQQFSAEDVKDEQRNDELFGKYQTDALKASQGISALAELE